MLELARTVRFCINEPPAGAPAGRGEQANTFSAWPAMRGLGRYYELTVRCRGEADPITGYFLNIKAIDQAVRDKALPRIEVAALGPGGGSAAPLGALLRELLRAVAPELGSSAAELTLALTPFYRLTLESHAMDHVIIRQRYEFSAAHRLHVESLSAAENRAVFGKCNNPAGHGHNYQIEVAVRVPIDPAGRVLDVAELDRCVDRHAIDVLDHKHLNVDIPAFSGLNPSVEHIAQVVWSMLTGPIAELGPGVELVELSVWETGKTVCTYRGPGRASGAAAGSAGGG